MSQMKRFIWQDKGTIAATLGIAIAVTTAAGGYALDYALWNTTKWRMQTTADSAALAASRALVDLVYGEDRSLAYAAEQAVGVAENFLAVKRSDMHVVDVNHDVTVDSGSLTVHISMSAQGNAFFAPMFHVEAPTISVQSHAVAMPDLPVCLLGLNEQAEPAVVFNGDVSVEGIQCAFWSNSTQDVSMKFAGNVAVNAGAFCAAGGVDGGDSLHISPAPVGYCRQKPDPLADWSGVTARGCDHRNFKASGTGTVVLRPGVYCGGMKITGSVRVIANPGIYVIKDGPFSIRGGADLIGDDVGFYVTGRNAYFDLGGTANLDISAPTDGEMAGLAFAQDRNTSIGKTSTISGSVNMTVSGSIYLPTQDLKISGAPNSIHPPEFTNIIAATITVSGNKEFILTGAENDTEIPNVAAPVNGTVRLTG